MFFVLVLSPKDGARARNRSICEFDYEHEHHFIEHEHEFKLKDVGKDEGVKPGAWQCSINMRSRIASFISQFLNISCHGVSKTAIKRVGQCATCSCAR